MVKKKKQNPRSALALLLILGALLLAPIRGQAADPVLQITIGSEVRRFDALSLLGLPEADSILVPHDVAYLREMTFRAVPLQALLTGMPVDQVDTLETRATDGFVSQLPMALIIKAY